VLVNLYLRSQDAWFGAALLFIVFLPLVYYVGWHLVIGPLNVALGVEGEPAVHAARRAV
jgi:hypothetical protein